MRRRPEGCHIGQDPSVIAPLGTIGGPTPPVWAGPRCRGSILLVDPNLRAWHAVVKRFERRYVVTHVTNQAAARAALFGPGGHADLVILEQRLPDTPGLRLLAEIKRRRPAVAVVMVTGWGSESICASAFRSGADDYLRKPIDVERLVRRIRRALAEGRMRRLAAAPTPTPEELPTAVDRGAQRVGRVLEFLQAHYADALTLPAVALLTTVTPFTLSREFSRVTGGTFRDYLLGLRVEAAAALLRSTASPVNAIARRCGFRDLSGFHRAFKKRHHVSPRRYRWRASTTSPSTTRDDPQDEVRQPVNAGVSERRPRASPGNGILCLIEP